jgi:L-malate glycosyltransferase
MKIKILLLSDINSGHTQKWVKELSACGITIGIFSFTAPETAWYRRFPGLILFSALSGPKSGGLLKKTGYLFSLPGIKRAIRNFKPDLLHAHYASSYGFLGALTGFSPFIISVWGSDIFDFPKRSIFHRMIIENNLRKADLILSTSRIMAEETGKYTRKEVRVIPFGIDLSEFKPLRSLKRQHSKQIVIGSIKNIETIYGTEYLIRAFKITHERSPDYDLRLMIIGDGSQRKDMERLVSRLGLSDRVLFTGRIEYRKIVLYHNRIDIFVNISLQESFGVSVLEASACGKPVIASNVGGLPEVLLHGKTGLLVPPVDPAATAAALIRLVRNRPLRQKMGKAGIRFVRDHYNIKTGVKGTLKAYDGLING